MTVMCTSCGRYSKSFIMVQNEGLSCPHCLDTDPPVVVK